MKFRFGHVVMLLARHSRNLAMEEGQQRLLIGLLFD